MKLPQFQNYLRKNKIDLAFFAHPDTSVTYFTQHEYSFAFLLIMQESADLFITKLDKQPTIKGIKTKIITADWEKGIASKKIKKIGINKNSMTVALLEKLKKFFPKAKFVDVSKEVNKLRSKKTKKEVEMISKACKITSDAFNALVKNVKKLKTEQGVALFLEKEIRSKGASLAFPTIVAMRKNAAVPHHLTSTDKLTKGFLLMDFGARYKNYCADMTRVIYLGKAKKEEKEIYSLLLKVQQEAIKEIAAGKKFEQLDVSARKKLGKHANNFIHLLGHGIGVEVHEAPSYSSGVSIEKEQVFTIEPGIYFKNQFGLRIEDTVYLNKTVKILTTAPKKLIEIA